jgi:hypothetical protein
MLCTEHRDISRKQKHVSQSVFNVNERYWCRTTLQDWRTVMLAVQASHTAATQRLLMDLKTFVNTARGRCRHWSLRTRLTSCNVWSGLTPWRTRRPSSSQKCSIRLRSRLRDGQSRTYLRKFCVRTIVWGLTLSCWSISPGPCLCINERRTVCKIWSLYWTAIKFSWNTTKKRLSVCTKAVTNHDAVAVKSVNFTDADLSVTFISPAVHTGAAISESQC